MNSPRILPQPPRPLVTAVAASLLCLSLTPVPMAAFAQTPANAQAANAAANAKRFKGEPVTLNFVNADIEGVSRAMGAILKQQFIVDPRVKGTITLYSDEPLSPREAYLNFLAALRGLGFTVVESGGLFKVVPEADAKLQSDTVSSGAVTRRGDQIVTQIFKINHENANNLVPVLRPLISPNNTINANPGNNTLVVTDYADNLVRIGKIIAAMDTPGVSDVEVIPLKHAVAADVAQMVQRLSDGAGATPGAPPMPGTGGPSVIVDPRANALIVRAPNAARMAHIRQLVEKLDRPMEGSAATGNIYVVYLKNSDAVRLATVLRAAYTAGNTGAGGAAGGGGGQQSQGGLGGTSALNTSGAAGGSGASGASPQATAPVQQAAAPSTGGMIQADPATNSLIITAPEPVYRQLRAVIDQLDSRRAQVYIESMIVEINGDNAADFGFQWQGIVGKEGDKNLGVVGTNFGSGTSNILGLNIAAAAGAAGLQRIAENPPNGFNIGLIRDFGGVYGLAAIAKLMQSQTNTNIVSTPNLITLDNEEAKIVVGTNVPFITGSFTSTGTAATNPFQTIERKDVGLTLRIKPQIGENGTVRMSIYQESSDVIAQVAGTQNTGPSTTKRSIESTVMVDDGQIIVLGGLVQDRFVDEKSKVPLLGDIPILGALFRSESRSKRRSNLMVFLRPIVMRDAASANSLSLDRYDMIRAQQKDSQPNYNFLLPINESPVVPPLRTPQETDEALRQRQQGAAGQPQRPGAAQPAPAPLAAPQGPGTNPVPPPRNPAASAPTN
jgi:general secretion pathway protein D